MSSPGSVLDSHPYPRLVSENTPSLRLSFLPLVRFLPSSTILNEMTGRLSVGRAGGAAGGGTEGGLGGSLAASGALPPPTTGHVGVVGSWEGVRDAASMVGKSVDGRVWVDVVVGSSGGRLSLDAT